MVGIISFVRVGVVFSWSIVVNRERLVSSRLVWSWCAHGRGLRGRYPWFYNVHNKRILFLVSVFAVHPKQSHEIRRNIRGHSAAPNLATETPSGTLRTNSRSKTPQHLVVDMLPMDHPDQDYYPKPKFRSRHRNSNQSRSREEFLGGGGCGGGGGGKGAYMRKKSQMTHTHKYTYDYILITIGFSLFALFIYNMYIVYYTSHILLGTPISDDILF